MNIARCVGSVGGCLAAMATCSAWASEAAIEKNDAPESATKAPIVQTALQSLIDVQLKHPHFSFKVRSFGFGNDSDTITEQHTWAYGGRLGVTFPEWHSFSIGGAVYASVPAGDAEAPNRSLLVKPNGKHLLVAGESYLNARRGNLNLRLYRQLLDAAYLNDQDTRMVPNVFEGYTLFYKTPKLYAGLGYVSRMKARNSEDYVSMSEIAGAAGSHKGVMAGGVRWHPNKALTTSAIVLVNEDTFGIAYVAGEYDFTLSEDTDLRLSAQYTAQESVGDELIGSFDTDTIGAKVALGYRRAVFALAGTTTDDGANIRSPFGQRPSYASSMLFDFDRAGEDAWFTSVSYRLDALRLPSWSFVVSHAEGTGARDPATGAGLPRRRETDFTVDCRPKTGTFQGLWLRLRYADGSEGGTDLNQWRLTFNYEFPSGGGRT